MPEVTRDRLAALLVVVAVAAPSLLLAAVTLADVTPSPALVAAALGVPLAAITLGLAGIGRRVAAEPDDPAVVSGELAEAVDMTAEEYRELTED